MPIQFACPSCARLQRQGRARRQECEVWPVRSQDEDPRGCRSAVIRCGAIVESAIFARTIVRREIVYWEVDCLRRVGEGSASATCTWKTGSDTCGQADAGESAGI